MPVIASIASSAWLVTTTSTCAASVAGPFGEAVLAERAPGLAEALAGGDADLTPGLVADAGHQLVAVAGLGLVGPLVQPLHLAARAGRSANASNSSASAVVSAAARVDLVHAQVVAAALEDGELRAPRPAAARARRPAAADRGRRAGAAARWSRWRRRRCGPTRRRAARSAPGRPATCRCRCRPARRGARRCRSRAPPPTPSSAGSAARRRRAPRTAAASSSRDIGKLVGTGAGYWHATDRVLRGVRSSQPQSRSRPPTAALADELDPGVRAVCRSAASIVSGATRRR